MRPWKHLVAAMLTLMLVLQLFGCGSFVSDPEENSVPETKDNQTQEVSDVGTEETTSVEASVPKTVELSAEEAKRELLVLYPGVGEGQAGYYENTSPSGTNRGPESFVVEDGKVYVLDRVNHRIICYAAGTYSEIQIATSANFMQYADGRFYVATETDPIQFYVYEADGTEGLAISLPEVFDSIDEVLAVDESSIEFVGWSRGTEQTSEVRYEWETGKYSRLGSPSSLEIWIDANVRAEYLGVRVFAEAGDDKFYDCIDEKEMTLLVNRQSKEGSRWYVTLGRTTDYYSIPTQMYYCSSEGEVYVMECFRDRTVISELILSDE